MGKESIVVIIYKDNPSIIWIDETKYIDAKYEIRDGIFHMTGMRCRSTIRTSEIINQEELNKLEPEYVMKRIKRNWYGKKYVQQYAPAFEWLEHKHRTKESISANNWIIKEL